MDRERPPLIGTEKEMLLGWLRYARGTVELKCEGLSATELKKKPISTSELSLVGLVRHLTNMEVSRLHWFAGLDTKMPWGADDFEVDTCDTEADLDLWRQLCARGDEAIETSQPDDVGAKGRSLRGALLSLLHEYQRHSVSGNQQPSECFAVHAWRCAGPAGTPPFPGWRRMADQLFARRVPGW